MNTVNFISKTFDERFVVYSLRIWLENNYNVLFPKCYLNRNYMSVFNKEECLCLFLAFEKDYTINQSVINELFKKPITTFSVRDDTYDKKCFSIKQFNTDLSYILFDKTSIFQILCETTSDLENDIFKEQTLPKNHVMQMCFDEQKCKGVCAIIPDNLKIDDNQWDSLLEKSIDSFFLRF